MQVWIFAPTQPAISAGYNPLAHIHDVEDAQDFAEAWVSNTGTSSTTPFWDECARLLISAVALHLVATERAPAFSRLADIITTQGYEGIKELLRKTRSPEARWLGQQFLENMEMNERLIGSIMTEIIRRFQLLASPKARAVTATNDIRFDEMVTTPTAFYLSIPPSATRRYRPLLATMTMQMFKEWEKGTNGIACYLDEFSNIGHIPGYADFISTARALKVALFMAIQEFSQLDERYGKNDATSIKSNAITHLLLPGAGLEECEYYSKRIGDTTVASYSVNRRGGGLLGPDEVTTTESETRRRLMTPDELRTMPADTMLMIEATAASLLLKTRPYFLDSELAKRADRPYSVTRVRAEQGPPPEQQSHKGLPSGPPPIIVDADIKEEEDEDGSSFFQR